MIDIISFVILHFAMSNNTLFSFLSNVIVQLNHLEYYLSSIEDASPPIENFYNAVVEFKQHVVEQIEVHNNYCCKCEQGFSRISSSDDEF